MSITVSSMFHNTFTCISTAHCIKTLQRLYCIFTAISETATFTMQTQLKYSTRVALKASGTVIIIYRVSLSSPIGASILNSHRVCRTTPSSNTVYSISVEAFESSTTVYVSLSEFARPWLLNTETHMERSVIRLQNTASVSIGVFDTPILNTETLDSVSETQTLPSNQRTSRDNLEAV